jgi:methionyl aminopeptidase
VTVSIKTPEELKAMQAAGRVVRLMLEAMKSAVREGITTLEIDELGAGTMREHGARSAPSMVYKFPGVSCISVNDEIVHGIPGARKLRNGDLLKLDVTIEKDGFMADAAESVIVGSTGREIASQLIDCARRAFDRAMSVARAGNRISAIGAAVEAEVNRSNFFVIRELCGHGIGRTIHERPNIPNYNDPHAHGMLTEGLVITVEPIIASRSGNAYLAKDGWTMRTTDHGLAAHHEHTLMITSGEPLLLTAA